VLRVSLLAPTRYERVPSELTIGRTGVESFLGLGRMPAILAVKYITICKTGSLTLSGRADPDTVSRSSSFSRAYWPALVSGQGDLRSTRTTQWLMAS
jgi:hypothetical protein